MIRRRTGWLLLGWLVLAGLPAAGAGEPVPADPAWVQGRLPNGLRYFIRRNAKPEKRVELRLAVDAGSALEDDDQRGIAHLVEHLCFRGTRHYPHAALVGYLQSLGSDFGPHVNAQTSFDETIYRLGVPSDSPAALAQALQVLRDWAGEVDFSPAEIQQERQVVVEEWRLRLGPGQRLLDQALPVLFPDSRYATRLPMGRKETVESASPKVIHRFYTDWYRPDNMAVVIAGDVDPAKIEADLRAAFADLPAPAAARPKPDLAAPLRAGASYSIASDPETGLQVVRVSFPRATRTVQSADDFRQRLEESLLVQALNARLAARREQVPSPFQLAQASDGVTLARARSELLLLALVGEGGAPAGLAALVTEAERLRRHGLTPGELTREKARFRKAAEEQYAERDKQESAALADAQVTGFLRGEPPAPVEWAYRQSGAALDAITPDDLRRATTRLLGEGRMLVRVEMPRKPGVTPPAEAVLAQVVAQVQASPIEPYREQAAPVALLPQPPEPGQVIARKTRAEIGVTELTFANGVRVVLKPSTFKQDEVVFSAYRPGGLSALPADLELAGKLLPAYFSEGGLGAFSKSDLQKLLAGKKVGLLLMLDPFLDLARGGASAADLETALQLIHLGFGPPRRDDAAYQNVVALSRGFETNVVVNPTLSFLNDVAGLRFGDHPRAPRLVQPEAAWKDLSLDRVQAAWRERLGNAAGFTFFFAGNFTVAAIEPLLARYLGSLPTGPMPAGWQDLGLRQVAGPFARTIERGADPKALVACYADRDAVWTLRDTHLMWSLGNILERTLVDRLRLEQGNVYTLKVTSTLEKIPYPHYTLEVAVPCAPDATAGVARVLDAEIERLRATGPSAEELQKEIEAQKRALEQQAQNNGDWLWKLELIYKYDEGFGRLETPTALLDLVTTENLREAARQYWRTDRWVRFELRPKPAS